MKDGQKLIPMLVSKNFHLLISSVKKKKLKSRRQTIGFSKLQCEAYIVVF